jgi:hypothetical protein
VPCVEQIPIGAHYSFLCFESLIQSGARIWSENVKRSGLDTLVDRPFDSALKHSLAVIVHPEDEAPIDHHTGLVQSPDRRGVVAVEVLILVLFDKVVAAQRFKPDEQTP